MENRSSSCGAGNRTGTTSPAESFLHMSYLLILLPILNRNGIIRACLLTFTTTPAQILFNMRNNTFNRYVFPGK